jgi:hypothetical protein
MVIAESLIESANLVRALRESLSEKQDSQSESCRMAESFYKSFREKQEKASWNTLPACTAY